MKIVGTVAVRLTITVALAALLATLVPPFSDRRDYAAAVSTYANRPTLENGVVVAH